MLTLLAALTGFKGISVEDTTFTVECCHGNKGDTKLQVAMTFAAANSNGGDYVLEGVQVSKRFFGVQLFQEIISRPTPQALYQSLSHFAWQQTIVCLSDA